ncbi:hypothetical protein LPJ61_003069 [Coemansia biformis]|uniref:F-box domain-containing protein n=1 Tax=Coemansia biformis TaxID=1286918 RepID=A0A9W7YB97_9FUNG|nr:hypothetical protein LPJ61_003069 [Coemansia biformis]
MHINDLPDEVLSLVIGLVEQPAQPTRGLWEKAHPVLSICRRWRCIALPIVYRELFVWCEESADADCAPSARPVLTTNAGLVADLGVSCMARSLCMTVFYSAGPVSCVERALDLLRSAGTGHAWSSVRKLDLFIHPVSDDALADSHEVASLACAFAALLPGVVDIHLDDHVSDSFTVAMYRSLVDVYARQLRCLKTSYIWDSGTQPLARLAHLEVRFDMIRCRAMPGVSLDGLVSLHLAGAASHRVWHLLAGSNVREAAFDCLERLHVSYIQDQLPLPVDTACSSTPALRLAFPRLRDLEVHNAGDHCPVTTSATLPPAMDTVTLSCTAAALRRFAAGNPPRTKAVRLAVDCEDGTDCAGLFILASRLLQRSQQVLDAGLRIDTDRFVSECRHLDWPQFTRITVVQSATRSGVVAIIHRLPQLAELIVCGLDCGLADAAATQSSPVALPSRQSLRVLALYFCHSNYTTDAALAFLASCVQSLAGLELVRVYQLHSDHIVSLIQSHARAYPHIANVQFDCADMQIKGQARSLVRMVDSS